MDGSPIISAISMHTGCMVFNPANNGYVPAKCGVVMGLDERRGMYMYSGKHQPVIVHLSSPETAMKLVISPTDARLMASMLNNYAAEAER